MDIHSAWIFVHVLLAVYGLEAIKAMQTSGPTPALKARIQGVYPRSRLNAHRTWAASFVIAFPGVTKIV
ncbi:MAG: hypothetical protein SFV19_15475 [Rhodospirillaceae bacterium]|nr:hypothetical protein [Rhodospirillaceae bacterium]